MVRKIFGDKYHEMMAMYPRSEYGRPVKRVLVLASEAFCSRGFMAAEDVSALEPVYYYSFDWDDYLAGGYMGAFHGLEIPFVFGNVLLKRDSLRLVFRNKKVAGKADPLSEIMMSYWANFARTGDPNGGQLPEWPAYNTETRERIHLDTDVTAEPIPDDQAKRYEYGAEMEISTDVLH
jgi:para-nitrobenzyl esterase